jgi:hypothetical protein
MCMHMSTASGIFPDDFLMPINSVVHLNYIAQGAHLIDIYGNGFYHAVSSSLTPLRLSKAI